MSLTFYYFPQSERRRRCIAVAPRARHSVREGEASILKAGEHKKPEFLEDQPGTARCRCSCTTASWLGVGGHSDPPRRAVRRRARPLSGPRTEARRGFEMAGLVQRGHFGEAVSRHQHNTSERIPADQHNEKAAVIAKADVEKCLDVLNQALEGRNYLLGEALLARRRPPRVVGRLSRLYGLRQEGMVEDQRLEQSAARSARSTSLEL